MQYQPCLADTFLFCSHNCCRPVHGGVISRQLFHDYIMVWIEDTRLQLLDNCKAEKVTVNTYFLPKFRLFYFDKSNFSKFDLVYRNSPTYTTSN